MAMTWRHWALVTIVVLLVLPVLGMALKSHGRQTLVASAAAPAVSLEYRTQTLPPGWTLDAPPAPEELVWYRGRRIPWSMAQAAARASAAELAPQFDAEAMNARAAVNEALAVADMRREIQNQGEETRIQLRMAADEARLQLQRQGEERRAEIRRAADEAETRRRLDAFVNY